VRPSAGSLRSPRPLWRLNLPGLERDYSITQRAFKAAQIFTDQVQIGIELPGMLHAEFPHFFDVWVFHVASPKKASGETISGHSYPAFSTACRIIILVNGLFMWEKFHVTIKSIPATAATAI